MKRILLTLTLVATLSACTNMNKTGENTTPEGTVVDSRTNADMEDDRIPANGDSVSSPGSNAAQIKKDGKGNLNGSNDNATPIQ